MHHQKGIKSGWNLFNFHFDFKILFEFAQLAYTSTINTCTSLILETRHGTGNLSSLGKE